MVIYVGKESRFLMNSSKIISKKGKTDLEVNDLVFMIFMILSFFSVALFIISGNILNKYGYVFFI